MDVEDGRHFRNRGLNTEPPWDAATSTAIGKHVLEVADVCCREQPPRKPSVYTGEGGIALMLLKLALLPGFGERQALLQQAHDHVRRCHPHFKPTRFATFLEGKAGALCIEAAVRHLMGQPQEADRLCMQLLRLADDVMAMPLGECEVLYGRCGYLYSILFLRKVPPPPPPAPQAAQVPDVASPPPSPPLKNTVPVQVTWPRSASTRKVTRVTIRVPFTVLYHINTLVLTKQGQQAQ